MITQLKDSEIKEVSGGAALNEYGQGVAIALINIAEHAPDHVLDNFPLV